MKHKNTVPIISSQITYQYFNRAATLYHNFTFIIFGRNIMYEQEQKKIVFTKWIIYTSRRCSLNGVYCVHDMIYCVPEIKNSIIIPLNNSSTRKWKWNEIQQQRQQQRNLHCVSVSIVKKECLSTDQSDTLHLRLTSSCCLGLKIASSDPNYVLYNIYHSTALCQQTTWWT